MKIDNFKTSNTVCLISGCNTTGTGFCAKFQGKLYLITDSHVMFNRDRNTWYSPDFVLRFQNQEFELPLQPIFRLDMADTEAFLSEDLDLCILELSEANVSKENGNIEIAQIDCFELANCDISELWSKDVFFYGIPASLHIEAPFDCKPLLTKGVISAYDKGEDRFVTDIPVYYGNSGSPAFIVYEDGTALLVGIVQQLIQFNLEWKNRYEQEMIRMDWHNSGYSICRSVNTIITLITRGHASKF